MDAISVPVADGTGPSLALRGICAGPGLSLTENGPQQNVTMAATVKLASESGIGGASLVGNSNGPATPYTKYFASRRGRLILGVLFIRYKYSINQSTQCPEIVKKRTNL